MTRSRDARSRDERGVVLTWLLQIVVVLAVISTVLFDAGSLAWNYFGVDSEADEIALELSEKVNSLTAGQLEDEAKQLSRDAGGRLVPGSLKITKDQIELEFKREATTIVVSRIGAIEHWGKASATGTAPTS